jgi:exosortase E/protease (VPEID-CTERM system)
VFLIAIEVLVLSILYLRFAELGCRADLSANLCRSGSLTIHRLLAGMAMLLLFRLARPAAFDEFQPPSAPDFHALAANICGFLLLLLPGAFAVATGLTPGMIPAIAVWIPGGLLAIGGGLALFAPLRIWVDFAIANLGILAGLLGIAMFAPEIKDALMPLFSQIWLTENPIADTTFTLVAGLLEMLGYPLTSDPSEKVMGVGDFFIRIHTSCSGVQGFALTTGFLTIYMGLMWRDLAFPAAFLLFPIGIFLSWVLNVVRITALVAIGLEGAPGLAVGGFHSYAGSLAFTALSLGLIVIANRTPVFRRAARPVGSGLAPPLRQDPVAARILPFVVFMLSGIVVSTFTSVPALHYPWRLLAMLGIILIFLPHYRAMAWRLDPLAVVSGLAIAIAWVIDASPADPSDALNQALLAMGPVAFVFWVSCRTIGTIVAVPLIEEVFFRGYLLERLGGAATAGVGHVIRITFAVAVSTTAFALLHDKWLLAGMAGLIFAALALRRNGRLGDAVISHMIANAAIAGYAIATGNWAVI